ncbi:MAG: tRNA (N(6)-L-threonylcarbamoyladenosine(37)-C(2))-methylthiotransferase MtaB [Ignavibacteriales bacterium]|nr:tRNA (N(6)-L-threonylcarbamoyladenosine(37)-C(2))-methylthiotransferase MtaB [Ignavibacteriales bacterium]
MKKKVAFHTLGCKLNYTETTTIAEQFRTNNFEIVNFNDIADVYVINSCTVTNTADKETKQIIRRAIRKNPDAFIIIAGCYSQLKSEVLRKIEGVDAILGVQEKFQIFDIIQQFDKRKSPIVKLSNLENDETFYPAATTNQDERTRGFLKIQDGCDYFCSYCTIPLARGHKRSARLEDVTDEFKILLSKGFKEIILTGVNVGEYGNSRNYDFIKLLNELIKIEGEFRIRISSIEPNLISSELIDLMKESEKICNHLHTPLQSGSDKILKLMSRKYSTEKIIDVITKATKKVQDIGIGSDIIVGFPGESEEDFLDSYKLLESLPISYLHVFTYSERENTVAAGLPNKIEQSIKKQRNNQLRLLGQIKKNTFYKSMIGKKLKVLFEQKIKDNFLEGFSSNYVRVKTPYGKNLVNTINSVDIVDLDNNICIGKILK